MAPNLQTFPKTIEFHTQRALCAFGKLVATWAVNPPEDAKSEAGGRILLLDVEAFRKHLSAVSDVPLEDREVSIDRDIRTIELVVRAPASDRATMLLPAADAIAFQNDLHRVSGRVNVEMPKFYAGIDHEKAEGGSIQEVPSIDADDRPLYVVSVIEGEEDPMEAFLYPYLGNYMCSQCI